MRAGNVAPVTPDSRAHSREAMELIRYLEQPEVQIKRATTSGDPPAIRSAYTETLFARAPYYRSEKEVFGVAIALPATPQYPLLSSFLQAELSAAINGQKSPQEALDTAQKQIAGVAGGS